MVYVVDAMVVDIVRFRSLWRRICQGEFWSLSFWSLSRPVFREVYGPMHASTTGDSQPDRWWFIFLHLQYFFLFRSPHSLFGISWSCWTRDRPGAAL